MNHKIAWGVIGSIVLFDFATVWATTSTLLDGDKDVSNVRAFVSGMMTVSLLLASLYFMNRLIDGIFNLSRIEETFRSVKYAHQSAVRQAEQYADKAEAYREPLLDALDYIKDPSRVRTSNDRGAAVVSRIESAFRMNDGQNFDEAPKRAVVKFEPHDRGHMFDQLEKLKTNQDKFKLRRAK